LKDFGHLAEFMVAEALVFSGKYADSSWVLEELKERLDAMLDYVWF
jgi:hypothetical protein